MSPSQSIQKKNGSDLKTEVSYVFFTEANIRNDLQMAMETFICWQKRDSYFISLPFVTAHLSHSTYFFFKEPFFHFKGVSCQRNI